MIQEPGTDAEIKEFAKGYNAEFDLFSKIEVNGDNAHPLWKWMKAQPKGKGTFGKWVIVLFFCLIGINYLKTEGFLCFWVV